MLILTDASRKYLNEMLAEIQKAEPEQINIVQAARGVQTDLSGVADEIDTVVAERNSRLNIDEAIVLLANAHLHLIGFLESKALIGARDGFAEHERNLRAITQKRIS